MEQTNKQNTNPVAYNIPSSRGNLLQNQQVQQARYLKHNMDLNSPRTQQAFLNLGLTIEDIQQKPRQQVNNKSLSEEANEFKFKQYVNRVNDAVKRIQHERKELMRRNKQNALTLDQVLNGGISMMRPQTSGGVGTSQYNTINYPQSTKNQIIRKDLQSQATISGGGRGLSSLNFNSTIKNGSISRIQNGANQTMQNNNQNGIIDTNQYQLQLIKSQGNFQIQKEQNELKSFLTREKEKTKMLKNMEKRFAILEEKQKEKMKIIKEIAKAKDEKRQIKSQAWRQKEAEWQKSIEKKALNMSKQGINRSLDKSQLQKSTMMSSFKHTASQIMIQQRIQQSKQRRFQMDQEVEQKIERDKQQYIEKQLRSAINHELVMEDMVSNLRDKTQSVQLQKHEFIQSRDIHNDLLHEVNYLTKTEQILKKRDEQEKRFEEKAKRLQTLHMAKRERFESHKKEQQSKIKDMQKQQMAIERSKYETMTSIMRGEMHNINQSGNNQHFASAMKMSESMSRLGDRHGLLSANSSRGFSRAQKEKIQLKREIVEENLDRERRKLEWKKLNILAKEQIYEEKIKAQRDQQKQLLYSQNNMRIKKNCERDKIISTITLVKAAPFSPTSRRLIERTLPQSAGQELMDIYRDSSEERRKKKEDEKNQF
eukprot:403337111